MSYYHITTAVRVCCGGSFINVYRHKMTYLKSAKKCSTELGLDPALSDSNDNDLYYYNEVFLFWPVASLDYWIPTCQGALPSKNHEASILGIIQRWHSIYFWNTVVYISSSVCDSMPVYRNCVYGDFLGKYMLWPHL